MVEPQAEVIDRGSIRCRGLAPLCHQVEIGNPRDSREWKQVPAQGGSQIPSWYPSLARLPSHNRYQVLEIEGNE